MGNKSLNSSKLLKALIENINDNSILGSIWKASIKTLTKLFMYKRVTEQLENSKEFDT